LGRGTIRSLLFILILVSGNNDVKNKTNSGKIRSDSLATIKNHFNFNMENNTTEV